MCAWCLVCGLESSICELSFDSLDTVAHFHSDVVTTFVIEPESTGALRSICTDLSSIRFSLITCRLKTKFRSELPFSIQEQSERYSHPWCSLQVPEDVIASIKRFHGEGKGDDQETFIVLGYVL